MLISPETFSESQNTAEMRALDSKYIWHLLCLESIKKIIPAFMHKQY